ncbi:unnamed protein product [Wuchereria bancrofti]|uniref:Uncharacterized protein n=1 Tax=Wuchereria bancrofti TaxID=6293 RepID=A0A3P7FMD3_WUCBA|nr:unnamed protein product [Wuchereria bancrofti]
MKQAFDVNGKYHPFDLNLPRNLPKRRALRDHGVKVDYVYCSAALRCVQTAVGIIKGFVLLFQGLDSCTLGINVERGLYEWMHWCRNGSTSVTHGPSVDALTRQLCGGAPRTPNDFMCRLQQIPYLACLKQWNNPSVVIVMLLTVVVITVLRDYV